MSDIFISMEDLFPIYNNLKEDELIVDVRSHDEFAEGHVPNSDHIPHEMIAQKAQQYKGYSKVYIYCRRGARAKFAYDVLLEAGLTNLVCVSDGGMDRWREAGNPEQN